MGQPRRWGDLDFGKVGVCQRPWDDFRPPAHRDRTVMNGAQLLRFSVMLMTGPPAEWQSYDVVWTRPEFNGDGSLKSPAVVTVFWNGVLAQDHFALTGETLYIGKPFYKAFDAAPIKLQAHGDKSEPISFRNIWVRELH